MDCELGAVVLVDEAPDRLHPVGPFEERREVADAERAWAALRGEAEVRRGEIVLGESAARREHVGVRRGGVSGDHGGEGGAMEGVVVHRERCAEVGDRLLDEARPVLRLAEVLQDSRVPRLQRGGTLELDDRGGFLTGVEQR